MRFFDYFRTTKPATASVAKERLQIIVAHERAHRAPRESRESVGTDTAFGSPRDGDGPTRERVLGTRGTRR